MMKLLVCFLALALVSHTLAYSKERKVSLLIRLLNELREGSNGSGDNNEASSGDSAQASSGGSDEASSGGSDEASSGGSDEASSGDSTQASSGGSDEASSGNSTEASSGDSETSSSGGGSKEMNIAAASNSYKFIARLKKLLKLNDLNKNAKDASSGSGSGSMEASNSQVDGYAAMLGEDFVDEVMERCNIDLRTAEIDFSAVNPGEVKDVVDNVRDLADELSKLAGVQGAHLETLENTLEDPATSVDAFIQQHAVLLNSFSETVESMEGLGLCAIARIIPIRVRMELVGLEGFKTDHKCNRAGVFLLGALDENNWDFVAAAQQISQQLAMVGELLREDVRCLLDDIHDYKAFVQTVNITPDFSARQAILTIDSLTGYMTDIGSDTQNLLSTSYYLHYMLTDAQKKHAATSNSDQLIARLKKLLKVLNEKK